MSTVKAILTKPLDGFPEGEEREFEKADFDRLKAVGAVRAAPEPRKAADSEKAAPAVENKMAPPVANKAALRGRPRA